MQQQQSIIGKHLHISLNPYCHRNSGTPGTPGTRLPSYLQLGSMRELPLLAPQWLQSDLRGRGSNSPLPDCNHDSPHSHLQGEVEIPKHGERTCLQGLFMTEDATICIDQTTLQSVCTCTQVGMEPGGDQPTEPILSCELSVVTVPSCIRPSKRSPSQRELHWNCETPPCGHTDDALREGGLTPTSPCKCNQALWGFWWCWPHN
jgi:hypothetical protein